MNRGFTILELLVVIVIIVILAGLMTPWIAGEMDKAKIAAASFEVARIQGSIIRLDNDTSKGPFSRSIHKTANVTAQSNFNDTASALLKNPNPATYKNWRGPYISARVKADPWGGSYMIDWYYPIDENGSTANGFGIVILSFGPDGKTDTADDVFKHILPNL